MIKKTILLTVALVCAVVQGAWAESVTFNVRSWDSANKQVTTTSDTQDATVLGGAPGAWWGLSNGYYVVKGNVEYKALSITGDDVHLILADGATLTCSHVKLELGYKLHIHSQSDGDQQGKLVVTGNEYYSAAGIGGGNGQGIGYLYVHGGKVEATGYDGAGIGGGDGASQGGIIYIYGGDVKATGAQLGAGIGGGSTYGSGYNGSGGIVYIYGGRVEAKGSQNIYYPRGAGIGGGSWGSGGRVYIYGGETYAYGGFRAAGVGGSNHGHGNTLEVHGGYLFASSQNAPAIGSGFVGDLADVLIDGGTVCAVNSTSESVIGTGTTSGLATLDFGDGMKVSWGNEANAIDNFTKYQEARTGTGLGLTLVESAYEREATVRTKTNTCVLIEPCDHQDTGTTYIYIDNDCHAATCNACCATLAQEAHTYPNNSLCVCGKKDAETPDMWDVTLYRAAAAGSTSYTDRVIMKVVKGQPFTIPAVSATQGLTLMGYATSWTAGDGIEMKDGETLTAVGTEVTPEADMNYYPRYRYRYEPTWTWDEDNATATLTVKCSALSNEVISVTDITYTTDGSVKTATGTYSHNGATYTFTDTYILPVESLALLNNASNEETLDNNWRRKVKTLTLIDRNLYTDGSWNTLCLPFDHVIDVGSALYGATVKTLESTAFDSATGTLTLNFTSGSLTTLSAGVPYIVKWQASGKTTTSNPIFNDVTLDNTLRPVKTDYVDFAGSFVTIPYKTYPPKASAASSWAG